MKKSSVLTGVTLFLIVGTALLLSHLQSLQRLGTPGVKVSPEPIYAVDGQVASSNTVVLPASIPGWQSQQIPIAQIVLDWLPDDTVFGQRLYRATNGFEALMNVVLMGRDRTSLHKPQYCLTGGGWQIINESEDRVAVTQPHAYELPVMKLISSRSLTLTNGTETPVRGVYVYWFVADNQLTAQHGERMWWMARDLVFTGVLQRWAYVSCFAICPPGAEDVTYARMSELIAAAVPQFQSASKPQKQLAKFP